MKAEYPVNHSRLWKEDLHFAVRALSDIDTLYGKRVLVTGASGLIGSTVTELLLHCNIVRHAGMHIMAAGRNTEKLAQRFEPYGESDGLEIVFYDALSTDSETIAAYNPDYIIHAASNAHPGITVREPVGTIMANVSGVYNLLRAACSCGTIRLLYVSSSEVYGKKEKAGPFLEEDYGFVDLLNVRSAYPVGKRAAETMCAAFSSEYGFDTVIVRPGHIYGPTASKSDTRVSSAFAYDAAAGKDLVLKSNGSQIRSYCYCVDCATAILKVLTVGTPGEAYNISDMGAVISIKEMARMMAEAGNVGLSFEEPTGEEEQRFNPMNNSSLDAGKLENLGWKALFDAKTGLGHTVEILKAAHSLSQFAEYSV